MVQFWTEYICLQYSDLEAAKRWWIATFGCKQVPLPDWDNPLPSDIAMTLPGTAEASILLSDRDEALKSGNPPVDKHQMIFCKNLQKAREYLGGRGAAVGGIQNQYGSEFFEVRDNEENSFQVCEET